MPLRYSLALELPLWISDTEAGALLRSLSVARAQGGTAFRVTQGQWRQLRVLTGFSAPPSLEELEAIEPPNLVDTSVFLRNGTRGRTLNVVVAGSKPTSDGSASSSL